MKRMMVPVLLVAGALAAGTAPALGQARERPAGSDSSGGAAPRSMPMPSMPEPSRAEPVTAPTDSGRSTSSPGDSGRARPRSRAREGTASTSGDSGRRQRASGGESPRTAVPRGDRPRGDRAAVGTAVPRTSPPYAGGGGGYPIYRPYWWNSPAYWYGYGAVGLGYFYPDPFWWGGYPGWGYGGYSGGYYGPSYAGQVDEGMGQLRLKVKPKDAEVYIDGYFVGLVDDFDGTFQRLNLETGPHRVEIRKSGFAPLQFAVRIEYDETVTYRGELSPAP